MINSKMDILKRNALLNVIRQIATIVFPLITFPYISRILQAENYGKIAFTASIISYISLLASLGISNYAIREASRLKNDKKKFIDFIREIFTLNCLSMLISYLVLVIIFFCFIDSADYRVLLFIQGITVFFNVVGCDWLNVVYEDYLFITVRYIALQIVAVILMLALVKSKQDLYLYSLISQMPIVMANMLNIVHFRRQRGINVSIVLKKHIFSHLKQVLILFGNAVSMLIYVNSDCTLIGVFCGAPEVGVYSVAVKIYTIVKQLLNALMVVGIPRMARWTGKKSKEIIDGQLNSILDTLLIFLIPCIVGLFFLSDAVIYILSGTGYSQAKVPLQILALTLFFSVAVCFYSNLVLIPNNMENKILRATIISATVNIVLNILFIPKYGIVAAAYTTLLSEFITVLQMFVDSRNVFSLNIMGSFFISFVMGGVVAVCCLVTNMYVSDFFKRAVISVLISGLAWIIMLIVITCLKKQRER